MMKQRFRVVHIIGGGEFGGAEDHIIHLMQQLRMNGIDASVICFYDALFAKKLREQKIPVDVLSYGRFDIRLLFGLVKLLKAKQPDIVHTHGVKANFFGRIAAKWLGIFPVVTTVHSLLKYDYTHPIAYRLAYILETSTRKKNDYYIAISNNIKEQLLKEKIAEDKIEMIHHGINTEKFAPKEDIEAKKLAKEWGKTEETFLVGAVGRIQAVKGFHYFIKACSILHQRYPNRFRFVIIGDGPQKVELEQLIKKEGLTEVFHLPGFRNDVDRCLRALDCYVSSSLSEGLGLAVMEALATGIPVVTTGVGGILDFAKHEENCLIVEPKNEEQLADAIERIYLDPMLAQRLAKTAAEHMQQSFSLEKMGKLTALHYERWLGRGTDD